MSESELRRPTNEEAAAVVDHPMRRESDKHVFRFDGTINIPTMLGLFGALFAVVQVYNDLDKRTESNSKDILTLQAHLARSDQAIVNARADQAVQVQQLKTEMRSDLGEIKSTLNSMLMTQINAAKKDENR